MTTQTQLKHDSADDRMLRGLGSSASSASANISGSASATGVASTGAASNADGGAQSAKAVVEGETLICSVDPKWVDSFRLPVSPFRTTESTPLR